jgi:hypothetical protein
MDNAQHVIGYRLTHQTRVQSERDDVLSNIPQALENGTRWAWWGPADSAQNITECDLSRETSF